MRYRKVILVIVLGTVILCIGLVTFTDTSCANRSVEFLEEMDHIDQRWFDALVDAEDATPTSLDGPLAKLVSIRSEAHLLQPPECAKSAKISLITHMDLVIDAFNMTQAQEPEDDINAQFDEAWEWEEYYWDDLAAIKDE